MAFYDLFNWQSEIGDTLHIRVTAKAASNRIKVENQSNGARLIRVYVTSVAKDGKANKAVIKLLSKELGIAKSKLTITHGMHHKDKTIHIEK